MDLCSHRRVRRIVGDGGVNIGIDHIGKLVHRRGTRQGIPGERDGRRLEDGSPILRILWVRHFSDWSAVASGLRPLG